MMKKSGPQIITQVALAAFFWFLAPSLFAQSGSPKLTDSVFNTLREKCVAAASVPNPASGFGVIYCDSSDKNLYLKKSDGTVVALATTITGIGGSGTTGCLSKFSGTSTLADSIVCEVSGDATLRGNGTLEFYKDSTPTKAAAIGLSVPGGAVGDDIVFAAYNGTSWSQIGTLTAGGSLQISHSISANGATVSDTSQGLWLKDGEGDEGDIGVGYGVSNRFDVHLKDTPGAPKQFLFWGGDISNGFKVGSFRVQATTTEFDTPALQMDNNAAIQFSNAAGTAFDTVLSYTASNNTQLESAEGGVQIFSLPGGGSIGFYVGSSTVQIANFTSTALNLFGDLFIKNIGSGYTGQIVATSLVTANRSFQLPDGDGTLALASLGTTGTNLNYNNGVLNVPDASASARGVVTTGAQTFGGTKTFTEIDITSSGQLLIGSNAAVQGSNGNATFANVQANQGVDIAEFSTTPSAGPASGIMQLYFKTDENIYYRNSSGTVTGPLLAASASGTTNAIPKWTAAAKLGNSGLSDDGTTVSTSEIFNANRVGTGSTAPSSGDIYADGFVALRGHTSFYGTFSHANTANRTYSLPDASGNVALASLGTSGTDLNYSSNGTLNVPDASGSARGVVNTGTQTFAGTKTFSSGITLTGTATLTLASGSSTQIVIGSTSAINANGNATFQNVAANNGLDLLEFSTTPSIGPASGFLQVFPKTDDKLYYRNSAGAVFGPLLTSAPVTSVNGQTGAVTITYGTLGAMSAGNLSGTISNSNLPTITVAVSNSSVSTSSLSFSSVTTGGQSGVSSFLGYIGWDNAQHQAHFQNGILYSNF